MVLEKVFLITCGSSREVLFPKLLIPLVFVISVFLDLNQYKISCAVIFSFVALFI